MNQRVHMSPPYRILVATELGTFWLSLDEATFGRFEVARPDGKLGHYASIDDKQYHVRGGIERLGDGTWAICRTDKGNESVAAFSVTEVRAKGGDADAPKKIRDRVRAAVLGAINAHLSAHPELVAQARAACINNKIRRNADEIAKMEAAIVRLKAENAKLEEEERTR